MKTRSEVSFGFKPYLINKSLRSNVVHSAEMQRWHGGCSGFRHKNTFLVLDHKEQEQKRFTNIVQKDGNICTYFGPRDNT